MEHSEVSHKTLDFDDWTKRMGAQRGSKIGIKATAGEGDNIKPFQPVKIFSSRAGLAHRSLAVE